MKEGVGEWEVFAVKALTGGDTFRVGRVNGDWLKEGIEWAMSGPKAQRISAFKYRGRAEKVALQLNEGRTVKGRSICGL